MACAEHVPAAVLPDVPDPLTFDALQVWAAQVVGDYEVEVGKRRTTADCLDALRKSGAIR